MVLSEKALAAFDAAAHVQHGRGRASQRAAAREAVTQAAAELKFDAMAPPRPDFAAGESTLAAAVRFLELTGAAKALEQYRCQRAALERIEKHYAALERRRNDLRVVELDRLRQAIQAGRPPEPAGAKLQDELDAIRRELDAAPADIEWLAPYRDDDAVRGAALTPQEWLGVVLYADLLGGNLRAETSDDPNGSPVRVVAVTADNVAHTYARSVNCMQHRHPDGTPTEAGVQNSTVRTMRRAIELAELHPLTPPRLRTLEELAGVPGNAA